MSVDILTHVDVLCNVTLHARPSLNIALFSSYEKSGIIGQIKRVIAFKNRLMCHLHALF